MNAFLPVNVDARVTHERIQARLSQLKDALVAEEAAGEN
jgi:hypothetical protein